MKENNTKSIETFEELISFSDYSFIKKIKL